jgi:hypothetical protein
MAREADELSLGLGHLTLLSHQLVSPTVTQPLQLSQLVMLPEGF